MECLKKVNIANGATYDIGWTPEIPLRQSLKDVINFWNQ